MFNIWQLFSLILLGSVQLALQSAIILVLFKKEFNIRKVIIYAITFTILHQIPISFFPINNTAVSLVFYIIISIFSIKFILEFNYISSFFAAALLFITTAIMEYVGMAIFKISFGNYFDSLEWSKSFFTAIIMRALGLMLFLMTFLIIYYFRIQLRVPENMDKKRIIVIVISLLMTLLMVIPNISFFLHVIPTVPTSIYIFNAVSLLFFLLFNSYSSIKLSELDAKSQQIEFQKLYINTLNDTINELRGFKHDFNNIIQVIDGYLRLNNIEGLKKYHK